MKPINLVIKGDVPSKSNQYRLGNIRGKCRTFKGKQVVAYEKAAALQIPNSARVNLTELLTANIKVYYSSRRPDLDNAFKALFDILQYNGVIENDRQVMKIVAEKFVDKKDPRVILTLSEWVDESQPTLFGPTAQEVSAWLDANAPAYIREYLDNNHAI